MDATTGGCTENSLSESIRVNEERLLRRRVRDRAQHASETAEQSEARLNVPRAKNNAPVYYSVFITRITGFVATSISS